MCDIIIIGGGPAGLTAGIYAARAGMDAVLLEKKFSGGQASTTNIVENYPGFENGIGGPELAIAMEHQAVKAGLQISYEDCVGVEIGGDARRIKLYSGEEMECGAIILSMGSQPRKLGVPGEEEFRGRGVSFCATCDGFMFRKKNAIIIGGGNTAIEDALYLANICESVTIIHRRREFRAELALVKRVMDNPKVRVLWDSVVTSFGGGKKLEGVSVRNITTGTASAIPADGAFVAVGAIPDTNLVKGKLRLDESGYIIAGEDTRTNVARVYAAGDLRTKPLRQIVTAAADGAIAATNAMQDLRALNRLERHVVIAAQ